MSTSAGAGPAHPAPFAQGTIVAGRFALGGVREDGGDAFTIYTGQDSTDGGEVSLLLTSLHRLGARKAALVANLNKVQRAAPQAMARVIAFGEHEGAFYVAQALPNGHTLRAAIDARRARGETVGGKTAHTLLGHLATGLNEAYGLMAHGAINPANVVIGRDGRITIEHWGLAQTLPELARRGAPAGAPPNLYIAPELEQGGPPTAQADVFSMGAMLYELLTGLPATAPLKPPSQVANDVAPLVDAVVIKAMSRSPLGRQGTPQILVGELAAALGLPMASAPPLAGPPPGMAGAPLPSAPLGVARVTGRTFNVAEAAGMAVDSERWLVQKGKLDFGPFSMAVLKQQIERGQFGSNDWITDTETGERSRIKDMPQLAEFARGAERNIEATRRAQAEMSLQHSERKKGRFTFAIVGIAVAVVGAGFTLYLLNRQDAGDEVLAERVGEADIDQFLKNVKIAFNQPQKPRQARRARAGASAGNDEFDTTQVLGDATRGGGDAVLDEGAIQRVMMGGYRQLIPCVMQERGRNPGLYDVNLEFVVLGSGKVSAAKVNGQRNTPFASCIEGRLRGIKFPSFDGAKTIASWSMSIR